MAGSSPVNTVNLFLADPPKRASGGPGYLLPGFARILSSEQEVARMYSQMIGDLLWCLATRTTN